MVTRLELFAQMFFIFGGAAWVFGNGLGAWWRRLHGDDASRLTAAWLAVLSSVTAPVGGLALLSAVGALFGGEVTFSGAFGPSANQVVLFTLWVAGVYTGLRTGPLVQIPPDPEPDLHGTMAVAVRSWSNGISLLLAAASMALVVPGVVLALFPRLRWGTTTTVRLDRDLVELRTASPLRRERLVRLSIAGGSVEEVRDLFGTPTLRLTGRDGVDLPLGGATNPEIDRLERLLRAATEAEPAPAPEPVPEALAGLRAQAARTGQVER